MLNALLASVLFVSINLSPAEETELQNFFGKVWSPYCKGNSLQECPSGKAEGLREDLRKEYEASGGDFEKLKSYLYARYGNEVKMEPESNLRGAMAYIIPWLMFMAILVVLFFYWKNRTRPVAAGSNSEPHEKLSHQSKIDEELEERLS